MSARTTIRRRRKTDFTKKRKKLIQLCMFEERKKNGKRQKLNVQHSYGIHVCFWCVQIMYPLYIILYIMFWCRRKMQKYSQLDKERQDMVIKSGACLASYSSFHIHNFFVRSLIFASKPCYIHKCHAMLLDTHRMSSKYCL